MWICEPNQPTYTKGIKGQCQYTQKFFELYFQKCAFKL